MSSPQIRRADRMMSDERVLLTLARGYSGRLATVSEDGFPYCIPLLYLWMNGEVYWRTTSAGGYLRANIDRERRVCFQIDEEQGVFDYGRFECDSGRAYRSVCLFGRIRIVEDRDVKQRFCEASMAKYGKPETQRAKGLFPRIDIITVYAVAIERMTGKEQALPPLSEPMACEGQDEDAKCFVARGRCQIVRRDWPCKFLNSDRECLNTSAAMDWVWRGLHLVIVHRQYRHLNFARVQWPGSN
jgi:nitroimidazol reductase NimA-like FMN-containing flavoprotein (pyridoxamine 5'-phosphate oxidase superfamily)